MLPEEAPTKEHRVVHGGAVAEAYRRNFLHLAEAYPDIHHIAHLQTAIGAFDSLSRKMAKAGYLAGTLEQMATEHLFALQGFHPNAVAMH